MIREFRAYDVPNRKYWNNWSDAYLLSLEGVLLVEVSGDDGGVEAITPISREEEGRFIFEQWTGMVDKNGTKIFEGDICRALETPDFYSDDQPRTVVVPIAIEFKTPISDHYEGGPDGSVKYSEIEVIGNIHDNPELLESQGKKEN